MKQIFACIGFLPFIALGFNTHSANAQSRNQSLWDLFVEESVREFGSQATQKVLRSMFGTNTDTRNAQQPDKQVVYEVIDPTGTPLNVRATPNGEDIVTTLSNGRQVIPYKVSYDEKNRHWILIGDSLHSWGWVYGAYVSCFSD